MSKKIDEMRTVPLAAGIFTAPGEFVSAEEGDSFELVPFAGQIFDHWYWGKMTFDAKGLSLRKDVIPAFKDHDHSALVGEITSIENVDGKVVLRGEFLDTDAAKQVRAVKKLRWDCSLAFDLSAATIEDVGEGRRSEVNGKEFDGPGVVVRLASLYECSFCAFGAVPGTETRFANDVSEVSTHFIREVGMSEGQTSLEVFQLMNNATEDKAFVAECFAAGMSYEDFQSALLKRQTEKVAELSAALDAAKKVTVAPKGQAPVTLTAEPAPAPAKLSFVELAHKTARDEKITLAAAYSRVAREHADLYDEHLHSAPVAKRIR